MANDRPNQTAVDYITIVLSPVLIMGLIGSLVFFLLEILYQSDGPWRGRLQWILFFFVFGAVLVGRISMNGDIAGRAKLYGGVLAAATYFALSAFVEYPEGLRPLSFLVNLLLVGLVWWCAHKLAWDCTNVDEETDMSGEGLLQASGLDSGIREGEAPAEPNSPPGSAGASPSRMPRKTPADEPELLDEEKRRGFDGWWRAYQRYRERQNKKRTLGTWVVYFSLAALPIFGLGQALIPVDLPDRRRWAFWLMTVYVGCGLGLLLTTCFLGLRRYLRQKRLMMPAAMTGAWLGLGASLVVGLIVVGSLLPRPYAESTTITDVFRPAESAERKANRFSPKGDSPAEGEGQPGEGRPDAKTEGDRAGGKGEGPSDAKDGKGSGKGDGKDGKGNNKDGKKSGSDGDKGKSNQANDQSKSKEKSQAQEQSKSGRSGPQAKQTNRQSSSRSSSSSPPSTSAIGQLLQRISPVLKWIVFAILAIVVLVALFRGGLGFLANFTEWARKLLEAWKNFWASLFGGAKPEGDREAEDDETTAEESERVVPFSAFRNPFDSGKAEKLSPRELVRYTFRAVEAWARERDLARGPAETALEFLNRVSEEVPAMEAEARRLGQLHGRAEYAKGGLPAGTAEQVRLVWEKLERVVAAPMSA